MRDDVRSDVLEFISKQIPTVCRPITCPADLDRRQNSAVDAIQKAVARKRVVDDPISAV